MKNLIWYLVAGTRGGETRANIIHLIIKKPSNANKIASALELDYKTVRHHLEILEKNNVIYALQKGKYGAVYFITELMDTNLAVFEEIWAKFGHNQGKSK